MVKTYRRSDPAAALLVLGALWIGGNVSGLNGLLHIPVTLADAFLLLAFVWLWPLVCDFAGMYDVALVPGSRREIRRVIYAATLGSLVGAALLPLSDSLQLFTLVLYWPLSAATMLAVRALLRLRTNRLRRPPQRVLIVGSGPRALEIWREVSERKDLGIEVLGYLDDGGLIFGRTTGLAKLGTLADAEQVLMSLDADEVLITLPVKSRYADVQNIIAVCERTGTEARYFADIFHFSTSRSSFESGSAVALKTFPDDARRVFKRAIDVVISLVGIIVAAPLAAIIAVAIRLDTHGPILYAQERVGQHRHRFHVLKFRTMFVDAESRQPHLEARNEASGPLFKIRNDPRVTRVGNWLRRSSMDELPQLVNVLLGHMSLVGPRPLPVRDVARFKHPWMVRRFSAPPGLTGLWQVHGRSAVGFDDFIAMDLKYIDEWSLALDMRILAATIPAVLRGHGAM